MRIEWLKFDDSVPARIKKKSLGFVPSLGITEEKRRVNGGFTFRERSKWKCRDGFGT